MELTRERLGQAFEMMGESAASQGRLVEIAVYGGACLLLACDMRKVTRDVDVVFLAEREVGYALADRVGRRLGLPDGWLNQAVKAVAPPKGNPEPNLLPFGEYPAQGPVGLRVFVPTPEYLLAMKLLANRSDDPDGETRDRRDILVLMKVTGLTAKADLLALVGLCYPRVPGITARLDAKIDDVLSWYGDDERSEQPSWDAPRGDPTR